MINLCIINLSPRKEKSRSDFIINNFLNLLSSNVNVCEYYSSDILKNPDLFENIIKNDKLIICSPLYADSLPSSALTFLYAFDDFLKTKSNFNLDTYGIINCGFLEGKQNKTALKILKNFCVRTNLNWKFGLGIGAGESLPEFGKINSPKGMKSKIYEAFSILAKSIENSTTSNHSNLFVNPIMPKFLFILVGNLVWVIMAKKQFNLKITDLFKKIY